MAEFMLLCLVFSGFLCFVQGQIFKISTKFMNGNLIFTWSNISTTRNDINIIKDSQSSGWILVYDDQYTVEDVTLYKTVTIKVREYKNRLLTDFTDYNETFNVNTQKSKIGESRNISWTVDYFPRKGLYLIFHVYNNSASTIMQIGDKDPSSEKYVYHTRPLDSVNIQFEVRNITLQDAGYYVGGISETDAWSGGEGTVLAVSGIPVKPVISGNLYVEVGTYVYMKCESSSTSAPYYYKKFPPLSYTWFVNNTRLDREDRQTYSFIVTKDVKYNRYSCQAKETLISDKSEEIRMNPLYLSDPKVYINGNLQNSLTLDEGSPLLLACNMEGNPIPSTTLKELTGNEILGQRTSTWLNHTLRREAVCSDTSTYSCEGSSSDFERKYQSFNINILCNPRLDMTTIVKANYWSISGPDVDVPVTVPVIANPPISPSKITWSGPSTTSILTNVDFQRDTFIYKQMIRSSIPIPDHRAFGNYSLMYTGKTIIVIIINAADKPQPPLNFSWYSYASGYVNLTWISNFNGGLDQVFTLYRKEGSNWRIITNLADPGEGEVGFFDPGLLNTGQEYWFRLESCNRISCSSRPAEVKVTVRDISSGLRRDFNKASTQTTWIVAGVLIGLSVLLLTNFGVYKFAFSRGIRSGLNQAPKPSIDLKTMNKEYDDVDDVTVEAQDQSLNTQTYEDVTENREEIQPLTDYQNISGHQDNQYEELKPDQDRLYSPLKVQ